MAKRIQLTISLWFHRDVESFMIYHSISYKKEETTDMVISSFYFFSFLGRYSLVFFEAVNFL